jgi:multimeric flavodoxin WrbA
MELLVLNGSPKGKASATMQYIHFIQKHFPNHTLNIINISQPVNKIENNPESFKNIIDAVRSCDAVVWAFPVYYMLVPGNYKRFIELIWERKVEDAFSNKPAVIVATSIKYMDHAAYYYMQAICEDLGMKYMGQFTPSMYDLEKENVQNQILIFARNLFQEIQQAAVMPRHYPPVVSRDFIYAPGPAQRKVDPKGKRVLLITDQEESQTNLKGMVERFCASFSKEIELVNLHDIETKGSCLGCIRCWYDHTCVYKDEYIDFMHEKVLKADIMIWAGAIKDRFLSSKWKVFLDRSFCNGHVPWLVGKQIGFIISGPLSQIPNIREVFEVFLELTHANLCGFVTDEYGDSDNIDVLLSDMAERMIRYAEQDYIRPITFLGYGSNLVLREMFWGRFRFPFIADWQQYYCKLDEFQFPHSDFKTRIINSIMMQLSRFPKFRKHVTNNLKDELIKPLVKVVQG